MLSKPTYSLAVAFSALLGLAGNAWCQTRPDSKPIAPGFMLRPVGVIDIGSAYLEINYYDSHWTISQQHDRFKVEGNTSPTAWTTEIHGLLDTAAGPAKVVETILSEANGIRYTAAFDSEKPLDSNELGMALILPLAGFGGKTMQVDDQAVELPMKPAGKGAAVLLAKDSVHRVIIPGPAGELTVEGNFALKLNDDREWNDPRYSLRFLFTPGTGAIKSSKIDLHLTLKPTA